MKIYKENLGEIDLTIYDNAICFEYEGEKINGALRIIKDMKLLYFNSVHILLGKEIEALKLTDEQYNAIELEQQKLKNEKIEKEKMKFYEQEKVQYNTSHDFYGVSVFKDFSNKAQEKLSLELEKEGKLIDTDLGDYTITYTYKITGKELIERLEKIELIVLEERKRKEQEQNNKIEKMKEEAKRTGKPVLYREYSVDCNDDEEDCDIDMISEYIMPDGTFKKSRTHTY